MKKTSNKLQLKTNTIRVLQNQELSTVQGGAIREVALAAPTNIPTNCSTSLDCLA